MIVPDANLLLYAYDKTSPFHTKAKQWWEQCLSGAEPVGLTHPVVFAFLRMRSSRSAGQSFDRELERLRAMSIESRILEALSLKDRFSWLKPAVKDS